jgi:iron(III) transport system ATP-binding protein
MIDITDIKRRFGGHDVLKGVSFQIPAGHLAVLFGPSGCGKTTLLRIIAGLEHADSGTVSICGRKIAGPGTRVKPEDRKVGLVFQDLALFPHLTVEKNIEFGIGRSADRGQRTSEMLELTHLESLRDRFPHELSGGEQQRVAVARALAPGPDLLLLDEPFANLDATLRCTVRNEMIELLGRVGTTSIMVTHDRSEALSAAQTLLVMSQGRLLQSGAPRELYENPEDRVVATLLGDGNLLNCNIHDGKAESCLGVVDAADRPDGPAQIFVRTEHITIEMDENGKATVIGSAYLGHDSMTEIRFLDGQMIKAREHQDFTSAPGSIVTARISGPCTFFDQTGRPSP